MSTGVTSTPSRVSVSRANSAGTGVISIADDEMITLTQLREHHRRTRGHTGGKCEAGFGLFQHGELVFELLRSWIVPAGVNKRGCPRSGYLPRN